jgi:hypothetical protein
MAPKVVQLLICPFPKVIAVSYAIEVAYCKMGEAHLCSPLKKSLNREFVA